jgi:hypothetical protein
LVRLSNSYLHSLATVLEDGKKKLIFVFLFLKVKPPEIRGFIIFVSMSTLHHKILMQMFHLGKIFTGKEDKKTIKALEELLQWGFIDSNYKITTRGQAWITS